MKRLTFVRCLSRGAASLGVAALSLQIAAGQAPNTGPHFFGTVQPGGTSATVPPVAPSPSVAVPETPAASGVAGSQQSIRAPFVGLWNRYVYHTKMHSVAILSADGFWTENGRQQGTWEVTGTELVLHLSNNPRATNSFTLPMRDGRLEGTDSEGRGASMAFRSAVASSAGYAAIVGSWVLQDLTDGSQATVLMRADGTWAKPEKGETGIWYIQRKLLRLSRNNEPSLETFDLPAVDGVVRGGSGKTGHALTLTRAGSEAASAGQAAAVPVVRSEAAAVLAPASSAGGGTPRAASPGSAPAPATLPDALPSSTLRPFLDTNLGAIVAPLDAPGFSRPEVIAEIKANFADGLAAASPEHRAAYVAAENVCVALEAALTERQAAMTALRGATATHISEVEQPRGGAAYGRDEAQSRDEFFAGSQKNAWIQRAEILRKNITALYLQERELEHPPKLSVAPAVPGRPAHPLDLLTDAVVSNGNRNDSGITLARTGEVGSLHTLQPPIRITYVAKTDSTNLRIGYAATQIIFNWDRNPNQLRIDGGPANGQHCQGAGQIPKNKYVTIVQEVTPTHMTISVDGIERAAWSADFSHVDEQVRVFPVNSIVTVQSITAEQIR